MWQKQCSFLRLANFVTGGDCATIQDTAQLAKLACGSFKVSDPLRWDVLDTLKLLACLVEQFGGSMKTSIWKSYSVGQDVGLKFGQTATGSFDIILRWKLLVGIVSIYKPAPPPHTNLLLTPTFVCSLPAKCIAIPHHFCWVLMLTGNTYDIGQCSTSVCSR